MRTFYQQLPSRRKRRTTHTSLISAIVFCVVLGLALVHMLLPNVLGGGLRAVAAPLWSGESRFSASISHALTAFKGNQRLVGENAELRATLAEYETFALKNRVLEEENTALKALFLRRTFDELVLAPILRRPPATPYDTLIVDVGRESGVAPGNRTVAGGTFVVGEVIRRDGPIALVRLYSSRGVLTPVVLGASSTAAVAEGIGNQNFSIRMPRSVAVEEGDPVLIPGITPHILGTVVHIESEASDPFVSVRVLSPINFQELFYLQIATNNAEIPEEFIEALQAETAATTTDVGVEEAATSSDSENSNEL